MNTRTSAAHQRQQEAIERFVDTIDQIATDPDPENEPVPESPFCALPWPLFNDHRFRRYGELLNASCASSVLVRLLLKDVEIRGNHESFDGEPPPFDSDTVEGLVRALHICMGRIQPIAEQLRDEALKAGAK